MPEKNIYLNSAKHCLFPDCEQGIPNLVTSHREYFKHTNFADFLMKPLIFELFSNFDVQPRLQLNKTHNEQNILKFMMAFLPSRRIEISDDYTAYDEDMI